MYYQAVHIELDKSHVGPAWAVMEEIVDEAAVADDVEMMTQDLLWVM